MGGKGIFEGLNLEQRRAVETVRGPVCILAGAGSGKTTTITRRIANQVASGTFRAGEVLAVTFTDKAAGEMRSRLRSLGAGEVRARTFHAAALAQLHHLAKEPPGNILPTKALALRQIGNTLPKPYKFRPAGDLATEIEWARNRRIRPENYIDSLQSHQPPIPGDLMARVFHAYESGKRKRGLIDFEDVLESAIRMFDEDEDALDRFRARYRAFTVDEYQDVNLLQQSLLDRWLGDRDDVCVVGDDYQSIYAFAGASPEYLLTVPKRFRSATVIRLQANYRSSPEVLDVANRLAPCLGGARKSLRPTRGPGPPPVIEPLLDQQRESSFIVDHIRRLASAGVSYEQIAILYRANFRSEDYEEALSHAGIPFQVRDGAFLSRAAARRILAPLRKSNATDVARIVRAAAAREGFVEGDLPEGLGEQEITRQNDLGRLVRLADEFDDGVRTASQLVRDLELRFGSDGDGRGVNLLTYHRAKGLEFEAVFLPRLLEGELPFRRAGEGEPLEEERRLLYVGITRAKTNLFITWPADGGRPSRFLTEIGGLPTRPPAPTTARAALIGKESEEWSELAGSLRRWRLERARADGVPAFVVFDDKTLLEIARRRPETPAALISTPGIGMAKLERYGDDIIRVVQGL